MQVRDVLAALADGGAVSGARLADQAGVTRAAVWKQVQALRERGVPIRSRGSAGYQLPWPVELLERERILAALDAPARHRLGGLEVHWELDSTSSELQRRATAAADLSVVLAETQSAGRGRRGRSWLSPPGLNIYLSCLKRFDQGFAALAGLSLAVGTWVVGAIEALGLEGAGLKWPNDVLGPQGKLAGILVELSGEYGGPCAAVIGIGVNVRLTDALRAQAGQPADDLAGLAAGEPPGRNGVAAALIGALVAGLDRFARDGFAPFAEAYARHDLLYGRPLRLSGALGEMQGTGAGIDERGALRLRLPDGSLYSIDSAEVTVRAA